MTKAFDCAVRLLSRREHSSAELSDKLKQKGFSPIEVKEALGTCQRLGLQSDHRFVEIYSRSRIQQGYGPLKICQELSSKGIEKEIINHVLQQEYDWLKYALDVWKKKCKGQLDLSFEELKKQQRFLLYRGFAMDTIALVKKELKIVTS